MNLAKIPATVVTGFLGSGKTTLLRHILENADGQRIAVIVNEFGELGIDGELLRNCPLACDPGESAEGDVKGIYELANGCICCTVQEEFFPVMKELVARRDQIDHILIETSGLALPKPLVQAFNWPEIKAACTVDAVITVVDGPAVAAGRFAANPEAVERLRQADPNLDHDPGLHELFEDQLGAADLVVMSKTDLMDGDALAEVEAIVRAEVPAAVKLVRSSGADLDLGQLLGLDSASEEFIGERHSHHDAYHTGHAGADPHHHDHDHDAFQSVLVELPESPPEPLREALLGLLQRYPIYRAKGFAAVPGKPMRQVIQAVGQRMDSYFDRRWRDDEPRRTRLVLIGRELDAALLQQELQRELQQAMQAHTAAAITPAPA